MAKLIMSDGSEKKVNYNKAAEIYQILTGKKEPKNKVQADFCLNVAMVKFSSLPAKKTVVYIKDKAEPDPELQAILKDKKLNGYAKFVAVGNRLKERQVQ